jgi:hypothetical protein
MEKFMKKEEKNINTKKKGTCIKIKKNRRGRKNKVGGKRKDEIGGGERLNINTNKKKRK